MPTTILPADFGPLVLGQHRRSLWPGRKSRCEPSMPPPMSSWTLSGRPIPGGRRWSTGMRRCCFGTTSSGNLASGSPRRWTRRSGAWGLDWSGAKVLIRRSPAEARTVQRPPVALSRRHLRSHRSACTFSGGAASMQLAEAKRTDQAMQVPTRWLTPYAAPARRAARHRRRERPGWSRLRSLGRRRWAKRLSATGAAPPSPPACDCQRARW
jgi:hypothetical protein